jgi:hypothetical protein
MKILKKHSPAPRRRFFTACLATIAPLGVVATAFAAAKTYKYKCPKCKLIQEYGTAGVKKCPNDGSSMLRQY